MADQDTFEQMLAGKEPAPTAANDQPQADQAAAEPGDGGQDPQSGPPRDERGRFAGRQQDDGSEPEARIPSGRLREEADARRRAEAERDAEREERRRDRERMDALERELRDFRRPAQREEAKPEPYPDVFSDPSGFSGRVMGDAERAVKAAEERMEMRFFNASLEDARDQNPEAFDKAFEAARRADAVVKQRIRQAANPGRELMRWHRQQEAVREYGDDPAAYRKRLREDLLKDPDFRKEAMAAWGNEARGGNGDARPGNVTDLPSVNRITGARESSDSGDDPREAFRKLIG